MSDDNDNSDPFDFAFDSLNANVPLSNAGEDVPLDLDDPVGNGIGVSDSVAPEGGVSADNPYLNASTSKQKKGWFAKSKDKPEKKEKISLKKERFVEEKKTAGERKPLELAEILCIAFSVFLLVSLLVFNVAAILTRGPDSSIMQTLCFIGGINIIGLPAAAVPILFYKFPQERTLPNVMLGISAVASFGGLLLLYTEFYRYSFILKP